MDESEVSTAFEWPTASAAGSPLMPLPAQARVEGRLDPGVADVPRAVGPPAPTTPPGPDRWPPTEPVIEVPDYAQRLTADGSVADEAVGVTPDGSVVDTRGPDTVLTLTSGETVTVTKDGSIVVDGPDEGGSDRCEVRGRVPLVLDNGTRVASGPDGVTVTTLEGEGFTVNPDGTVGVDLRDQGAGPVEGPGVVEPGGGAGEHPQERGPQEPGDFTSPATGPQNAGSGSGTGSGAGAGSGSGRGSGSAAGSGPGSATGADADAATGTDEGAEAPRGAGRVSVEPESLRSEAAAWDHLASELHDVGSQVDGLGLDAVDFGVAQALHGGYDALRTSMKGLTDAGRAEFTDIAQGLRRSARSYDSNEHQNTAVAGQLV